MHIHTFSIVAHDPDAEEWAVAVASKFLAAAAVVPWAKAKVGAIATQALANLSYGPDGLGKLSKGMSAEETIEELTAADEGAEHRQVGIVDSEGRAATYTGEECFDWAGGLTGDGFCVQGNILTGADVVESMKKTFEASEGRLVDRMLEAMLAGDRAGGDSRGRQSAGVLLVREGGAYGGVLDKAMDLRVDDHPDPVPELIRLRALHRLYLEAPSDDDAVGVDDEVLSKIQGALIKLGSLSSASGSFDAETEKALQGFMGIENLEMRWLGTDRVDRHVLSFLEEKAAGA